MIYVRFNKMVQKSELNVKNVKITIENIQDHDFDYEIGKMTDNEYKIKLYLYKSIPESKLTLEVDNEE